MLAIIDYGAGNLLSVQNALKHIGCPCELVKDEKALMKADAAILPGVGSFGDSMASLERSGLVESVKSFANSGRPFLGICLGLQLLFPGSEESDGVEGLGLLKGSIKRIPSEPGLKVPHIGWNSLKILKKDGIFKGIPDDSYVYFVHSYYLNADESIVTSSAQYGTTIHASVQKDNIFATQFHPEKSGEVGIQILKNFTELF